jgi:hypothetical protein
MSYLIEVLICIYNDSTIKSKTRLRLIKEAESVFPDIGISK